MPEVKSCFLLLSNLGPGHLLKKVNTQVTFGGINLFSFTNRVITHFGRVGIAGGLGVESPQFMCTDAHFE